MRSHEGEDFPGSACYLEIVKNEKLVWTAALAPGYRPVQECEGAIVFTAIIQLEEHGSGTKYTAIVLHRDEEGCKQHAEMAFEQGWGAALDQLVELSKAMRSRCRRYRCNAVTGSKSVRYGFKSRAFVWAPSWHVNSRT